jgi:hypothetical protein
MLAALVAAVDAHAPKGQQAAVVPAQGQVAEFTISKEDLIKARDFAKMSRNAYKSHKESNGQFLHTDWYFKERVEFSHAAADVYINNDKTQCVAAIAGSDDTEDWVRSNFLSRTTTKVANVHTGNTYDVPVGISIYYDLVQRGILKACHENGARLPLITTGHSLGGGAAEISAIIGDANESWAFAMPKTIGAPLGQCPTDIMQNSYSFYMDIQRPGSEMFDFVAAIPTLAVEKALLSTNLRGVHCAGKNVQLTQSFQKELSPPAYSYRGVTPNDPDPTAVLSSSTIGYLFNVYLNKTSFTEFHDIGTYVDALRGLGD